MSGKIDKEKIEKEHEKQQPVKEEDNSVVDDKEKLLLDMIALVLFKQLFF